MKIRIKPKITHVKHKFSPDKNGVIHFNEHDAEKAKLLLETFPHFFELVEDKK